MSYDEVLSILFGSAGSTLAICGRQSVKDAGKVVDFVGGVVSALTSKRAIETYAYVIRGIILVGWVAMKLGEIAAAAIDEDVARCEAVPEIGDLPEYEELFAMAAAKSSQEPASVEPVAVVVAPVVRWGWQAEATAEEAALVEWVWDQSVREVVAA